MAEYALSTNLWTFAQVSTGTFSWPDQRGEAEVMKSMGSGDIIVPKFAQAPTYDVDPGIDQLRTYCEAIDVDFDAIIGEYEKVIASGQGAVPFLLRVTGSMREDTRYSSSPPWVSLPVVKQRLDHSLSTKQFLLFKKVPIEIAAQFKGTVAPGRHLQQLPDGTAASIVEATQTADPSEYLRQYSVVEAPTADAALDVLQVAGRAIEVGNRVFIAAPGGLLGVHDVAPDGKLVPLGSPIARSPDELLAVFEDAKARARPGDPFTPARAVVALKEIKELLAGPNNIVVIDDFSQFHDRYNLLAAKVTQALDIAKRPVVPSPHGEAGGTIGGTSEDGAEEPGAEVDELAALSGLTVDAVRTELPSGMKIEDSVLADAVTALRAGKHLLLSGPPGTGKTTLAEALCRAVLGSQYDVITATADWTTFDTIGGYMPTGGGLEFEPGIVLRCLQRGRWLVIDELNRADIDKAFGPLFTLLAGGSGEEAKRRVVLPYQRQGKNIEIRWAQHQTATDGSYILTPGWRLLGTMNISDKAALFQLSFAFLRRFAIVDVPIPPRPEYEEFFRTLCVDVSNEERENIVTAGMELAFGARQLGPAILVDIASFMSKGLAETASGTPTFDDEVAAFASALRLYAVPQYEGAPIGETAMVVGVLKSTWPDRPDTDWAALSDALGAVALT